jgi:hypothetical protein
MEEWNLMFGGKVHLNLVRPSEASAGTPNSISSSTVPVYLRRRERNPIQVSSVAESRGLRNTCIYTICEQRLHWSCERCMVYILRVSSICVASALVCAPHCCHVKCVMQSTCNLTSVLHRATTYLWHACWHAACGEPRFVNCCPCPCLHTPN